MKTLKVLLQEVVSGIKAWVNSNFAQESNTVHKTGNETVNGNKTFTGNVFQNQAGGTNVYCATCDGAVKGDLTSSGTFSIVCKDGSSANMETSGLAAVYMGQDTSGSYVALRADTTYNNTRYNASVSLDIDPTTANNNAIFRPRRDNTIDLGSSSYQFKNLYANNYYYKGTAWGLDKTNVWTGANTFSGATNCILFQKFGTSGSYNDIRWYDNTDENPNYACLRSKVNELVLGLKYSSATAWYNGSSISISYDGSVNIKSYDGTDARNTYFTNNAIYPSVSSETDLGTSTRKWKSFNGLNPGALSLLDYNNILDVTSEVPIASLDGNTDINLNDYVADKTGWLSIVIANTAGNFIKAVQGRAGTAAGFNASRTYHSGAADNEVISLFMPIIAGTWKSVYIKASSLIQMRFYYCLGNV